MFSGLRRSVTHINVQWFSLLFSLRQVFSFNIGFQITYRFPQNNLLQQRMQLKKTLHTPTLTWFQPNISLAQQFPAKKSRMGPMWDAELCMHGCWLCVSDRGPVSMHAEFWISRFIISMWSCIVSTRIIVPPLLLVFVLTEKWFLCFSIVPVVIWNYFC